MIDDDQVRGAIPGKCALCGQDTESLRSFPVGDPDDEGEFEMIEVSFCDECDAQHEQECSDFVDEIRSQRYGDPTQDLRN